MKEATFIRLEPSLKRAVERAAAADGRTMSAMIAKIISDWVAARKAGK
jgi:predicted transcriptional regulator